MGTTVSNMYGMHFMEAGTAMLGFGQARGSPCSHKNPTFGAYSDSAAVTAANAAIAAAGTSQAAFLSTMASVLDTANKTLWDALTTAERTDAYTIARFQHVNGWTY